MQEKDNKTTYVKAVYNIEQLSNETGISAYTLRDYVRKGELKASLIGKHYVITRESLLEWIENHKLNK